MSEIIRNYVSRYVIPFYFDYEDDGYSMLVDKFLNEKKDYKSLGISKDCKWIQKGFWENYITSNMRQEMDIYTYLLEVFREDYRNKGNLGSSFILQTNENILKLQYIPNKESEGIDFNCNDFGILLFRNGIGFIWYDIELGKKVTVDEYIEFQYHFKELARISSDKFRIKNDKEDEYKVFCFGKWISQLIDAEALGIKFWAERTLEIMETGKHINIPDKSLLFQYLFVDMTDKKERMSLAFHIANGYDKKYISPTTLETEIYEPFGNTCFYTSKMGTAYVVSNNGSDAKFFEESFKVKYIRDYFFIYILLLYQTYSSAHYSRLLTKIPADIKSIESDSKYVKLLESLDSQINLFFVKSIYESVSNIQHQNGVYTYGKKALRIEEDMKSLSAGLVALRGIEVERQKIIDEENRRILDKKEQLEKKELELKEKAEKDSIERKEKVQRELMDKKDRALNKGLVIFGFLVVISVSIDALNLVDWFSKNKMGVGHWISLGIIAVLTIFMFFVLIINTHRKMK